MKNKSKFIILALIILISVIGISYAFFEYYKVGTNQKLIFGEIYLKMNEGTDTITLTNVFPETKEAVRKRTDNQITFTISGINTTTNKDIWYEIMLNEGNEVSGRTRFNPEDLVFDLIEVNEDETETYLVDAMSYGDIKAKRIWVETVDRNTTTEVNKTYKLRMWLSEDVFISDTNPNATYDVETFESSYASVKVSVYGDFVEKETSNLLANIIEEKLNLTDTDSNGARYVYGNNVNNYVWYSGKLWRIVSINNDGSIKLVTQGDMTSIYSNIDTWLDEVFLPTLHNNDNLLVEQIWDTSTVTSVNPYTTEGSSSTTRKIGRLTAYDYLMTGGTSDTTTSKTFLNNGYNWWTYSSRSYGYKNWSVTPTGIINASMGMNFANGVRPAINLIATTKVIGGSGIKKDPYRLSGDYAKGNENEKLNSRISGEYVNFNDVLYRIVGIEEINGVKLTKVTMADYNLNNNTLVNSIAFGDSVTFSVDSGIGKYLNDWYNADETSEEYSEIYINNKYKSMIATSSDDGVVWYQGPTTGIASDYRNSKTGTPISATIGMGMHGELFMSQFGEGSSSSVRTWCLSKEIYSQGLHLWYVDSSDTGIAMMDSTSKAGVRPSFYLKSNVVIGDSDGDGHVGTGLPNDPYEIKQVS